MTQVALPLSSWHTGPAMDAPVEAGAGAIDPPEAFGTDEDDEQDVELQLLKIERDLISNDLHPKLQEDYESAEKRMNAAIGSARERFIRDCATIQKRCLVDLDEAKELWREETSKLESVVLASLEHRVDALEREYRKELKKRERAAATPSEKAAAVEAAAGPSEGTQTGASGAPATEAAAPASAQSAAADGGADRPAVNGGDDVHMMEEDDGYDSLYSDGLSDVSEFLGADPELANPDDIGLRGNLAYLDDAGTPNSVRMLEKMNSAESRVRSARDKFTDAAHINRRDKEERLLRNRGDKNARDGPAQGVKRGRGAEQGRGADGGERKRGRWRRGEERPPPQPKPVSTPLATIRLLEEDERQSSAKRAQQARRQGPKGSPPSEPARNFRPPPSFPVGQPQASAQQQSAAQQQPAVVQQPAAPQQPNGIAAPRATTPPEAPPNRPLHVDTSKPPADPIPSASRADLPTASAPDPSPRIIPNERTVPPAPAPIAAPASAARPVIVVKGPSAQGKPGTTIRVVAPRPPSA